MSLSPTAELDASIAAAEAEWLERWESGQAEPEGVGLPAGTPAPDHALPDHTGVSRSLSEFWAGQPVLLIFWRHFGCSCGVDRAQRLLAENPAYEEAGLLPVIITQGEPVRASAYREQQGLPGAVLCDPDHVVYRAYGVGQWPVAKVLYDAPPEYWKHERELGASFQNGRRDEGRPPVDDPWRATAEFVIGSDGLIRLMHQYQHCEDFPEPRVFTTAALAS